MLLDMFGPRLDSIFTPPWNRCTSATGAGIKDAGIAVLSRDATAAPLGVDGIAELPIAIDWFAKSAGHRLTRDEWGVRLARAIDSARAPFGLMLHHAVMDSDEQRDWGSLLQVLARHPLAVGTRMRDAADPAFVRPS
jgi:hypothetical protein